MAARILLAMWLAFAWLGTLPNAGGAADAAATPGTIWAWGHLGQLNPLAQPRFPLDDVVALSNGSQRALVLQADGTAWEIATDGDLAELTTLGTVSAVDAGDYHHLAVKPDGSVWAWGANDLGQVVPGGCGDCSTTPTRVPSVTDAVAVAGGGFHSLALRNDGTVWAWGANNLGQVTGALEGDGQVAPQQVAGLTDIVQVAAGYMSSAALRRDGTVLVWGYGPFGVGGAWQHSNAPVQLAGLTDVTAISAGMDFVIALKRDGSVWAWGGIDHGQLGLACFPHYKDPKCGHAPVQVIGLGEVRAISAHTFHSLALRADGTVWSWGSGMSTIGRPTLGLCHRDDYDFSGSRACSPAPGPIDNLRGATLIAAGHDFDLALAPHATIAPTGLCFPESGTMHCIRGEFMDRWLIFGGLPVNGFPLSGEFTETLEDGRQYMVQYFERARFEHHPENAGTDHLVLLGQFGRRVLGENFSRDRPQYAEIVVSADPLPGQNYFTETGHNLGGRFLAYWEANGGLLQFGYPLTEEFTEQLENGNEYRVQYFERARFEHHPENPSPYDVLLGQFGRRILADNQLLAGGPFATFFQTTQAAQVQLGRPVSAPVTTSGAILPFERGQLLYLAEAPPQGLIAGGLLVPTAATESIVMAAEPTIVALCGGEAGRVVTDTAARRYFFADTWAPGQPTGGGAGPQPGLYEPQLGFGKVWRDNQQVRACLGYALAASETAATITAQYFQGGALLLVESPGGRAQVLLTLGSYCPGCAPDGTYERQAAPR